MFAVSDSTIYVVQPGDDGENRLFSGKVHNNVTTLISDQLELYVSFNEKVKMITGSNEYMLYIITESEKMCLFNPQKSKFIYPEVNNKRKIVKCGNLFYQRESGRIIAFNLSLLTTLSTSVRYYGSHTETETECWEFGSDVSNFLVTQHKNKYMMLTHSEVLTVGVGDTTKIIDTPNGVKKIFYVNENYFYLDKEGYLYKVSLNGEVSHISDNVSNILRSNGTVLPFITHNNEFCILNPDMTTFTIIKKFDFEVLDLYTDNEYYCYTDWQGQLYVSLIKSDIFCKVNNQEPIFDTLECCEKRIKMSC